MIQFKKINGWMVFGILFLTACQMIPSYEGKQVPPGNRLPFKSGGPHPGSWSGKDLFLSYNYERSETHAAFDSTIEFTSGVSNFPMMKRFGMEIFFLDTEGIVIGVRGFYNVGYGRSIDQPWRFKRHFVIPPETASIAFGYSGEAVEPGKDRWDGMDWSFWDSPFRSE